MRNLRRLICLFLTLCTLFSLLVPVAQAAEQADTTTHPFTDVTTNNWYYDSVNYVWEHSLFNGVSETRFAPTNTLNRGMFVTVLGRLAGIDATKYTTAAFDDVDPAAWYGPYVAWAAETGISVGNGDGTFAPTADVTREQIATFVQRYLKLIGQIPDELNELSYTDMDEISGYAEESIAVCLTYGLMTGDPGGTFRPKDNASRAEGATLFMRLHQYVAALDSSESEDNDRDDESDIRPPYYPDDDSGTVTTYYKITFANPTAAEYSADTLPDDTTVEENSLVYTLPLASRDGYVFCGWYYDRELTELAATTDTVTSNLTLYPKMVERTGDPYDTSIGALNYVASLDVSPNFTVQVKAQSEAHIRASLTFLDISNFDAEVEYSVTAEGEGIYTLTPTEPLIKGNTYQITAVDRDHDMMFDEDGYVITPDYILFVHNAEVQSSAVRYYNITVHCEEYTNLRINDDLIFIPYDQVSDFSFDNSALFSTDLESIEANNNDGIFLYEGGNLQVGDVVAIYDGVRNQENNTVDGQVAYVQIHAIDGDIYQYVTPDLASVVFMPKSLPVLLDDASTEYVDGAFFNHDGTITVYKEYLDFSPFAGIEELNLDGTTTARIGDYLVLYQGDMYTTTNYSYWKITGISQSDNGAVTTFTATETTFAELEALSSYDTYETDTSIAIASTSELEEEMKTQALESGFAEEAALYLAQTLLSSEELQEDFGGYTLQSFSVRSASDEEKEWYEGGEWDMADGALNIEAGQIEAGFGSIMVELGDVNVHVHVTESLQEINKMKKGIRAELGITFPVQIGTYLVGTGWADCIYLEVSASFVQEVAFGGYAKIDEEWDTWAIFPYISDVHVSAGVDFGTYTGVGATFTTAFDNQYDTLFPWTTAIQSIDPTYDPSNPSVKSIAKKLESMMNDTTTFLEGHEGTSLISQYQDMLSQEIDFFDILALKIINYPIPLLYNIIQVRIIAEFVISARMSVTMGMSLEHLAVKRYSMTLQLFSMKASTKVIDLQTPYTNLNFYVMGNLGLRAGPRVTVQLEALGGLAKKHNLVNVGANISIGPDIDLYGIFFYHFAMQGGKTTDSRGVGALEVSVGMYLDVDFFFGAFLDLVSANLHALDLTYYFWRTNNATRILEPKQLKYNFTISNDEAFTIYDRYLWMNTLKVRTGETGTRYNLTLSDFDVALSNKNFQYDATTGIVSVTPPDDTTMKMHCEIRLTYKGSDTLFVTSPITITINLTWQKTKPKYAVRFYSDTFLGGTYTENGYSGFNYWADWDTKIKETTYVAGDIIDFQTCEEPSKAGYDFAGWRITSIHDDIELHTDLTDLNNLAGYAMPEGNIDIAAFYTPRTDTPYTIEYYVETTAGTGAYELYKSVQHTGRTGSADYENTFVGTTLRTLIAEDTGTMDGYQINYNLYPKQGSGEWVSYGGFYIQGDGSTVVKVYFDRKEYTVFFHANNEDYTGTHNVQINGVYGAPLDQPADFTINEVPGYTFLGWANYADAESSNVEIPLTIPTDTGRSGVMVGSIYYAYGTHYFAVWKPNYNYITVNHYVENVDGTYSLVKTQVGSNDSEETHAIGGITGTILNPQNFLIDIPSATYSHCVCTTSDGIQTRRVVGATSAWDNTAQHNGQTLDIYYDRAYYRVTWEGANRNIVEYYYEGQPISAPEGLTVAQQQGYVVDGWKNDINPTSTEIFREADGLIMPGYAMYFEPNYVPAEGTQYKVIHKRISMDVNGRDIIEEEVLYGTTDSIVTPEVRTYDGHVSPEPTNLYIKADGTATLTYEYRRSSYKLTLDFNGGTEVNYARNYYYSTIFELPTTSTRYGYTFAGWALQTEGYEGGYDDGYITGNCLTSMQDLTFVAQWEAQEIGYKVEHYLENLDGTYSAPQTYNHTGLFDNTVTAVAKDFVGYTVDTTIEGTVESGTISSTTETLVLKLYYTRNTYEATWYDYDGTTLLNTTQFKYGHTITAPDTVVSRLGYTWNGWDIGTVTMSTNGASFNAKDHGTWTANTYTVTFHANGGEGSMETQIFTYDQAQLLSANTFTRSGYTFAGWSTGAAGETLYADQTQINNLVASGNVDLYAQWTAGAGTAYKVEYYAETLTDGQHELINTKNKSGTTDATISAELITLDGFTFDESNTANVISGTIVGDGSLVLKVYYSRNTYDATWYDYDGVTLLATTQFKYGQTILTPEITASRTGYTWNGWDIGTVTMSTNGASFNAKDHGTWTANTYTVTFHANGGEGTMESQIFTYDVAATLTPNSFSYSGYTFAGWSTEAEGEVHYADQAQINNLVTSGIVDLYAQWTAGTGTAYKVEYYVENLSGNGYSLLDTKNYTGTTGASVSAATITVEGFTFDESNVANVISGTIVGDGSLVLKVYYTRNTYDATWYDFDGVTLLATTQFKYGQIISTPEIAASRTGYTWNGWDIGTVTMTTNGASFNAKDHGTWTANTYTVTFHANGGDGTMESQIFTYDVAATLTPIGFSYSGYTFAGWSTEAEGEVLYADQAQISNLVTSGNVNLYAQWTAGTGTTYKVEYYAEDLTGDNYSLLDTKNYTGTTGASVSAATITVEGFTFDESNTANVISGTIVGDGSLVLKVYYTRNTYDATWYDYDGVTLLATTQFKYEQTISVPEITASRAGYTWNGWDIGTVTMTTNGASFNAKDHGTWTANTYTVTFHANGGDGTMESQIFTYDVAATLTPNSFSYSGYTFAGWSTEAEGEVLYADQAQINNLVTSGIVDLYAQWTAGTGTAYKVEYYVENLSGNGYSLLDTKNKSGTTDATISAELITLDGFTFDESNVANVISGTISGDGSLVLKVYYTRNTYDATWYDYDGVTLLTTTQFKYQQTISAPEITASRAGYTWNGWDIGTVTMTTNGASFNAKNHGTWTANTYTVTFHANGGEGAMESQSFTYDVAAALTPNSFSYSGYTFAGWSTDAAGETLYADQAEINNLVTSGNVDLYAQWTASSDIAYQVIYYGESLTDGYEVIKTDSLTGSTGAAVSASVAAIDGFTFDASNSANVTSGTIASDGSLVLALYYTRNSYNLILDFNGESMTNMVEREFTEVGSDGLSYRYMTFVLGSPEIEDQTITLRYGESLSDALSNIQVPVLVTEGECYWDEETEQWAYTEPTYQDAAFETAFPGYTFNRWLNLADTMPANNLTLTAEWTAAEITVVYYPGTAYATGDAVSRTYSYGDVVEIPTDLFTYDGYFITGWSYGDWSASDGAPIVQELILVDGCYDYYGNSYSVTEGYADWGIPTNTVYITACWADLDDQCTITFYSNGGEGTMTAQVVNGSGYFFTALKKNTFTLEGYRFAGWKDDNGQTYADGEMPMWDGSEVNLHAQWEVISE